MGLIRRLSLAAARRVSVLVVEVPGWGLTRCALERELRERGWRPALSPADADVLAVCGAPGPRLAHAVQLTWAQLPGPRVRIDLTDPADVVPALDRVGTELLDEVAHHRDAQERPDPREGGLLPTDDPSDDHQADDDQADDDQADGDVSDDGSDGGMDHDMGGMDHGMDHDMGGMDHDMDHDMDMDMDMEPEGIPLAGGSGDRDGLELDVLNVPLGPVLPGWPAGLLLHCTLSGDVVQEARAEVLGAGEGGPPPAGDLVHGSPADRCDRAATLLALAGWADAAVHARRLRDDLLTAPDPDVCRPQLDRLTRRVRRSRVLRWSLRGLGRLDGEDGHAPPGTGGTDVHDRLLRLLDQAAAGLSGAPVPVAALPLDRLADLVAGEELAAVRLVVAGSDLASGAVARSGAGTA